MLCCVQLSNKFRVDLSQRAQIDWFRTGEDVGVAVL